MSLLSLVMMVRDEAEVLPGFLDHHAGLYDQLVVVDTGSVDGTADLARRAGALVLEEAWQDDFSGPRNRGLAAAVCDWILILDADERVASEDFDRLRRQVEAAAPAVFLQETINYLADASHLEWQPVRGRYPRMEQGQRGFFAARRPGLFPNRPDLCFRGRIHESILPAAQEASLPVVEVDLPVHHYGYVRGEAVQQARKQRYLELARRKLADDESDWGARLELATAYLEHGDAAAAEPLLREVAAGPEGLRPVVRGAFLLGRILRERGELEAANTVLASAADQDPDFLFCTLELIRCEADRQAWARVAELLRQASVRFGTDHPLLGKERLRCQIQTHQLDEARRQARRLVELYPGWVEMQALAERLEGFRKG